MKHEKLPVTVAVGTALTTVVLSMVLNSWAFTSVLDGWFGHVVGILLPCWVLALTYMGHYLWPSNASSASPPTHWPGSPWS